MTAEKKDGLWYRCREFVTEQSAGEWDDKTIADDADKLMLFIYGEMGNDRPALIAERDALRDALAGLYELCLHANVGAFKNGVTDATGSIDEGEYHASCYLDAARDALGSTTEAV